jgi:hypothetical protein
MRLEDALTRLRDLAWQRNDCSSVYHTLIQHHLLKSIRDVWLREPIAIRARPWRPAGQQGNLGSLEDPETVTPYEDIHFHFCGDNLDEIRIYQYPANRPGLAEAEWRRSTISDEDFDRLYELLLGKTAATVVADEGKSAVTDEAVDAWMLAHAPGGKRDPTLVDCRTALKITHRRALAAWHRLPKDIRSKRGRPRRATKSNN